MPTHLLHTMPIQSLSGDHARYLRHSPHRVYDMDSLDLFLQRPSDQRVAVVEPLYHEPDEVTMDLLDRVADSRRVIVRSMEIHASDALMPRYDRHNFEWVTPGVATPRHGRQFTLHEHVTSTAHPYLHEDRFIRSGWAERVRPAHRKPHWFEVMLGTEKPHRLFCHAWVRENVDPAHYLMSSFFSVPAHLGDLPLNSVFREPGMEATDGDRYVCRYLGRRMNLSQVLPIQLYQQTQCSVVCETLTDRFFPTEKITKPILAQRLFVVLSCVGYLAQLRALGFRTFGHIIDESYDSEKDDQVRWRLALEQMHRLSQRPWPTIWEQLRPVVEHNLGHLGSLPTQVLLDRVKSACDQAS